MKSYFFLFVLIVMASGCVRNIEYHPAASQPLPEIKGQSVKVFVKNASGRSIQFSSGPLNGLVLGVNEYQECRLPIGVQYHRWIVYTPGMRENFEFSDEIIVTARTGGLRVPYSSYYIEDLHSRRVEPRLIVETKQ